MKAGRVEVSRDEHGHRWLICIRLGEEAIRRSNKPKDASETTLRKAAAKTASDEGYTVDASAIIFA